MPTTCKTWRCAICSRKMLSLFRMRVEAGALTLGQCAFMTITYKVADDRRAVAEYVKEDWRKLLRQSSNLRHPTQWLKVTELTKKQMPHHHLILGPVKGKLRCYGPDNWTPGRFQSRAASCGCLSHRVSRDWLAITGDSWNTHVTPVLGAAGAAAYLAKYVKKTFGDRHELATLGIIRRWSSSRGWPGRGRMRLSLSAGQMGPSMWQVVDRTADGDGEEWGDTTALRRRISNPLIAHLTKKYEMRGAVAYLRGRITDHDQNVRTETEPSSLLFGGGQSDVRALAAFGHSDP